MHTHTYTYIHTHTYIHTYIYTLHYIYYITLHLHCVASCYITLHYITLHIHTHFFPYSAPTQEEVKDWEWNPDVPTMKLFRCWDSSAVINKTDKSRSVNVSKEGELSGQHAALMMLGSQDLIIMKTFLIFKL